jgi:fatty-acyl-CoA synthase
MLGVFMLSPVLRLAEPRDKAEIERIPFEQRVPFQSVYEMFASVAARQPAQPALTFLPTAAEDVTPIAISVKTLFENITRAANLFTRLGATHSSSVGILLPILPDTHYALWGAESSSIAMPLNILLSVDHICDLLKAGNSRVLVALGSHPETEIWQKAEAVRRRLPELEVLYVAAGQPLPDGARDFRKLIAAEPSDRLVDPSKVTPHSIAAYFHTGGTTGAPKLAQHAHGSQIFSAWACTQMFHYEPGIKVLNGFPMFHVAGAIIFGLAALCAGAEVIVPTPAGLRNKQVVQHYWKLVERLKPTILCGAPTSIAAVLSEPVNGADISSARVWATGGALLPQDLANAFEREVGIGIHEIFGMTETAGVIAITPRHGKRRKGWIGFALPYCEMRVARLESNGMSGAVLTRGESGVVHIRGPNVFSGYVDPAKNRNVLLDDGWLMTGDIGRLDEDGYVCLTGRVKDVIIRGGHNIDPLMIEEAASQYPGVMLCAAVGQPDGYAGEVPVLYVTAKPGIKLDADELMNFVASRVAEPPARPRAIYIVPEIPTTEIGKIFKPALRLDATKRAVSDLVQSCGEIAGPFTVNARDDDKRGCVAVVHLSEPDGRKFEALTAAIKTAGRGLPIALEVQQA